MSTKNRVPIEHGNEEKEYTVYTDILGNELCLSFLNWDTNPKDKCKTVKVVKNELAEYQMEHIDIIKKDGGCNELQIKCFNDSSNTGEFEVRIDKVNFNSIQVVVLKFKKEEDINQTKCSDDYYLGGFPDVKKGNILVGQ